MTPRERTGTALLLMLAFLLLGSALRADGATHPPPDGTAAALVDARDEPERPTWEWPVAGERRIAAPYRAPAHAYGAGHRGVDLVAPIGAVVRAPADGVVAFRGTVVDRSLLTIEHAGGYVTTFEPLASALSPGDVVVAGDQVGTVDAGGHSLVDTLHLGVRVDGAYVNPLLLFDEIPRAILLPCCDPL